MTEQKAIGLGMSSNAMSRHDFADAVDAHLAAAWAEYEAAQAAHAARRPRQTSFLSDVRSAFAGAWTAWVWQPALRHLRTHRAPASDLRYAIDRFLDGGAPCEDILPIVGSSLVERQLAEFDRLDAVALAEQRRYWGAGWISRQASWLSVLVVPLLVFSADGKPLSGWDVGANLLHITMVGLTALSILMMGLRRSDLRWRRARYLAEKARAEVFRLMIQACSNPGQLKLALACFKAAHLDWQMQFYRKRIADLPRRVDADRRSLAQLRLAQVAFVIATIGVSFIAGISAVAPHAAPLPGAPLLNVLLAGGTPQWAFNGAFSLLAFTGARSFSRDLKSTRALSTANAYNRALYRWAEAELRRLAGELGKVEMAAARGDLKAVLEFRDRVQYVLDAENLIWALESAEQERETAQRARATVSERSTSASLTRS
ncbi:MAG TPA: hypothetical protein VFZ16_15540 [Hyphomicrobiaceae bacterium]|nr:hypothetical protein [Hyphomicrobiaceae bacterium]